MENNNKLIAEFLGWDINSPSTFPTYLHQEEETQGHWELKFNTDWNWLMEVVDKIESFEDDNRCAKYNINIEQSFVEIIDKNTDDTIVETDADTKIEATYNAVVEFIKWYNEQ